MIPVFSIDDYHSDNLRLAELFLKYGLEKETIFFIECADGDAQAQIEYLSELGFQIGSHTMTHAHLTKVDKEQVLWEITSSKKIIEGLTHKTCEAFCFPRGRYDDKIIKMLKDAGYKWARTIELTTKGPYQIAGVHLSYPRKEYNGKDPFEVAKESDLNHFWLHCFEILKFGKMVELEKFLKWYKQGGHHHKNQPQEVQVKVSPKNIS